MSSFVYQQGGSGGGGGASASIFVTGLTEDSSVSAETTATRKIPNPECVVPNGYTQLTYIEGTGTQYIDTGVTGKSGIKTELDFLITSSGLDDFIPMGCATANYANRIYPVSSQSGKWSYGYDTWQYSNTSVESNTRYAVTSDLSVGTQSMAVNGTTVKTSSNSSSVNLGLDMFLFALNLNGSAVFTGTLCVYSCEIYENGVAVRDYVPAKRNSDNVLGLYDLVNDVFYENAGTGTFVAGEEIPRYFEEPYGVLLEGKWTERIVPNPEYVVPDGYTQLEYIESTGTQYIDTGVSPTDATGLSLTMSNLVLKSNDFNFAGARDSENRLTFNYYDTYFGFGWGRYTQTSYQMLDLSEKHTYKLNAYNSRLVEVDDTTLNSISNTLTSITQTVYLFAQNYIGTAEPCAYRIYDAVLTAGQNKVRHYVPAKRNSDNVLGLYDLVNDVFYENAGTGTFLTGEEIPSTIDEGGFLIAPIRNLGMWTVTATDGEFTKTQDVLVDVITQFEIEMYLKLWLYNEGDECEDVTGGWTGYRRTTSKQVGGFQTNKEIDLTPYTTMHAVICTNSTCYSGLGTKVNTSASDFSTWLYKSIQFHKTGESETVPTEFIYDITNLEQKQGYFFMGSLGNSGGTWTVTTDKNSNHFYTRMKNSSNNYWTKIYKVWFE